MGIVYNNTAIALNEKTPSYLKPHYLFVPGIPLRSALVAQRLVQP